MNSCEANHLFFEIQSNNKKDHLKSNPNSLILYKFYNSVTAISVQQLKHNNII